jgi:hypothetical protein
VKTSTYSFGEDSPIKFQVSDNMARLYNQAAEEWFKAQTRFNQKFGRQWDPVVDPIEIRWSHAQRKAWNDFAKIFKKAVDEKGPFHENDIMDDFLVKNAASLVAVASGKWGRVISIAVAGGVLYGLLRRR